MPLRHVKGMGLKRPPVFPETDPESRQSPLGIGHAPKSYSNTGIIIEDRVHFEGATFSISTLFLFGFGIGILLDLPN